ncbi:hypothetical protein A2630_02655 [Candidatus Woesebacteria bacterium RIFCSPHIGHO2_01_FULL_44_10]|uniref:Uncharacterized protein n=1 Tax=Candidatus Woesebacteria bacterium RIFCSPLOWO2_01_FULL_44_14 TaxID=1802525 RepID=A0A1F8C3S1_9BACT|nr:MAG: hypothetical protein A2630_02655 [Candidatus Woesebacteria bacterium RIFCSPHIGHO2_01_FULL_44_10]OGM56140.1 MAG: hypothetical protein A3F62_00725 [Candidatus Woesebacteria bacterium RIFCSPHIGHO2_12_FULL_44_11]OGM70943.1 MAG: hypothetical protein A2975_01570 [Candidatus Woesebacteria bacterium RIFCSPLOWO2_01_FULL_44_14]
MNKYYDVDAKIAAADLDSLFKEIEQEKDRVQFFIKIAHYGEYIQENRFTSEALSILYDEARDDARKYLEEWKDFVKIWKKYAKDLLIKAKEAGIKDNPADPFSNEIASITNHLKDKDTSIWETDLSYYYLPYQTLIWKFKEKDKEILLKPKHLDPKEGFVMLYPYYVKAGDEWDKFKLSREAKVWWAHYQICRLAAGVLGLKEQESYFKRDNIIDDFYKYEFKEVAKGNVNRTPIVLHEAKYKVWISRLHNFLMPRLQNDGSFQPANREIDFSDTAQRRGMEKRWDVLKAIWTVYEAQSRPEAIMLSVDSVVIKDRTKEQIDGILDGLRRIGCFDSWNSKDRHYSVEGIVHPRLVSVYEETKDLYRKFAEAYELRKVSAKSDKLPNKREMAKEVTRLKKECDLGPKEHKLLKILSNFKRKRTTELTDDVPTDDYKHLKMELANKISKEGWVIENEKERIGLVWKYYYRLDKSHHS